MTFSGKLSTSTNYAAGIDLGYIESITPVFSGSLDPMSYPDTPASEQEFYDMSGASLSITVKGKWTGSSWSTGISWMWSIAALITGSQYDDAASRYLSVYDGSTWMFGSSAPIHVIVESFEPTLACGTQPMIEYTLKVNQQAVY